MSFSDAVIDSGMPGAAEEENRSNDNVNTTANEMTPADTLMSPGLDDHEDKNFTGNFQHFRLAFSKL